MPKSLGIKGNPRKNKGSQTVEKFELQPISRAMQPNSITYMRADYTLIQNRVFLTVLYKLRMYMERLMSTETKEQQLTLFDEVGDLQLAVSMSEFGVQAANFPHLRKNIKDMMGSTVEMPSKIEGERGTYTRVASLFTSIDIPNEKYQTNVYFRFNPKTVHYLIDTKTFGFTKYALEVALAVSRVSTLKMYQLISSWKEKQGFHIKDEELRNILLGPDSDKYPTVKSFYDNVIKKAYDDLFQTADVYFEIDIKPGAKDKEKVWCIKVISADAPMSPENKEKFEKERDLLPELIDAGLKNLGIKYGEKFTLLAKDSAAIKLLCRYDILPFIKNYVNTNLMNEVNTYINNCQSNNKKAQASDVSKFIYTRIKRLAAGLKK